MKDYFGKTANILNEKKLFLFDMDGTIYRENTLFEGMNLLFEKINNNGGKFAFITNNPSKSVKDYIKKLKSLGVKGVNKNSFFTSAQAAARLLRQKFSNGLIYVQGTKSLIRELKSNKIKVTTKYSEKAVAVLVSFDTELTSKKLRTTCEMLTKRDIPYYATNCDWVCPVSFGAVPDCGSMCFGIEKATGKAPIYIGKPQPTMILELLDKFSVPKEKAVVVGDRIYTDIASGINAGVDTVLVLCGEATLNDLTSLQKNQKPTFVFAQTKDLLD